MLDRAAGDAGQRYLHQWVKSPPQGTFSRMIIETYEKCSLNEQ